MYDRNAQNMLLNYTELKRDSKSWFLQGQLFRVGILLETTLGECYVGTRKLDGYKMSQVASKEFEEVTNQQALDSLVKKGSKDSNIEIVEYL